MADIIQMLIRVNQDLNQRQKQLHKQSVYKQMLDHQVLNNQQHKIYQQQQLLTEKPRKNSITAPVTNITPYHPARQYKLPMFPALKDRNVLYQGNSRFVQIEPASQIHKRTKTETAKKETYLEQQYFDKCQAIISQLQHINLRDNKTKKRRKTTYNTDKSYNSNYLSYASHSGKLQDSSSGAVGWTENREQQQTSFSSIPSVNLNTKSKQSKMSKEYSTENKKERIAKDNEFQQQKYNRPPNSITKKATAITYNKLDSSPKDTKKMFNKPDSIKENQTNQALQPFNIQNQFTSEDISIPQQKINNKSTLKYQDAQNKNNKLKANSRNQQIDDESHKPVSKSTFEVKQQYNKESRQQKIIKKQSNKIMKTVDLTKKPQEIKKQQLIQKNQKIQSSKQGQLPNSQIQESKNIAYLARENFLEQLRKVRTRGQGLFRRIARKNTNT